MWGRPPFCVGWISCSACRSRRDRCRGCLLDTSRAGAGELLFDDEKFDLNHASHRDIARIRQKTAFVVHNYNLFRNKTALQNVTEGLIVARKMKKADAEAIGPVSYTHLELAGSRVPLIIITHEANEQAIRAALAKFDPEVCTVENLSLIHISLGSCGL